MTVSTGSFDVGSGGDYATLNTARADIEATLTGDLTLTVVSNFTETVADTITEIALAGNTLTITSDSPHNGVFGVGHMISLEDQISFRVGGTGVLDIGDLQFDYSASAVSLSLSAYSSGPTQKIHDILVDGSGGQTLILQAIGNGGGSTEVYNCIHANSDNAGLPDLFEIQAGAFPLKMYNNVCDCRDSAFADAFKIEAHTQAAAVCIANNVALVASGRSGFIYVGTDSADIDSEYMYNNASTESSTLTGSNSPIEGFTPATEFVSDTFGETDFLKPAADSQFMEGGTATNIPMTVDIEGTSHGASPPVGAYVAAAAEVAGSPTYPRPGLGLGLGI